MAKKNYRTLILMPYLPLEGRINFSGITLWSFKKSRKEFIKDLALSTHLDKLVSCYQFHNGKPIPNPTIIFIGKAGFSNPIAKSIAKIEALKNILLFTCVTENNSWSFVTSDNFEVFYQRFNVGNDNIATQAGAIHRISTGGYKLGQITFAKPEHVNIPLRLRLKASILRALEECLKHSAKESSKSQIIQSLNPFFNAYRNSHEHSWASRILLLIIAFELLFGKTGRNSFRRNIQKYSVYDSSIKLPTYSYPEIDTRTGKPFNDEDLTLNQIWAEEFYKLRHRIIHGDTIYSDDFVFKDLLGIVKPTEPHFYIAINFFVVCLLNKLREISFKNVPHYVINPDLKGTLFTKTFSGIKNETFKIADLSLYDTLMTYTLEEGELKKKNNQL